MKLKTSKCTRAMLWKKANFWANPIEIGRRGSRALPTERKHKTGVAVGECVAKRGTNSLLWDCVRDTPY